MEGESDKGFLINNKKHTLDLPTNNQQSRLVRRFGQIILFIKIKKYITVQQKYSIYNHNTTIIQ